MTTRRPLLHRATPTALIMVPLAVVVGVAAAVGAALVSARPAVFLTAGLVAAAAVVPVGLWFALRGLRRPSRVWVTLLGAGVLVVTSVAVATPLRDRGVDPSAGPEVGFWELPTGSRLAYRKLSGTAPARSTPIVVLHGGPGIPDMAGDAAAFGRLTDLGYDVYLYDQLGSGRSTRLTDPTGYGIDRDVADLEQVRRAVGAERMVLIGHSYGGALAAHYLAAHPDRVERMILSSPGALDPADRSGARASAGLGAGARLRSVAAALAPRALLGYALLQADPAAAHAYLDDGEADARNDTILTIAEPALHCTPGRSARPVRGSGFYALQYPQSATAPAPRDVRPALTGLRIPTLVLKGSCDYLSWRSAVDYRRALPRTTLLYLEGAGHNIYQDRPDTVLAATRAFLTDRPPPQPPHPADGAPTGYRGPP